MNKVNLLKAARRARRNYNGLENLQRYEKGARFLLTFGIIRNTFLKPIP